MTESEGRQIDIVFTWYDYRIDLGISRGLLLSRPPVYNSGTGSEIRNDYNEDSPTLLEVLNPGTNACRPPHLRKGSARHGLNGVYELIVVPRSIEMRIFSSPWYLSLGEASIVEV